MPPKEKELNKNGVIGRVESVNVPRNFADQLKRHHLRYLCITAVCIFQNMADTAKYDYFF